MRIVSASRHLLSFFTKLCTKIFTLILAKKPLLILYNAVHKLFFLGHQREKYFIPIYSIIDEIAQSIVHISFCKFLSLFLVHSPT